ncbi:ASCH domain-containing protein [Fredinandcohnia sp. 179-A 10B2 NHS]|uniref:ASCH domain-containing protein n=1 Tax=Fredinandcohnia sp. 179-A 10B2 NHS TaxID=3235176 RepID=UPI0039A075D5
MKRIDFWGRDEHDERLLEEVLIGIKTVTCTPKVWYDQLPEEEKSEVGAIVQVYTKQNIHKANLQITDLYEIPFGDIKGEIGEKIAKGENSTLEEYIKDHIFSWEKPLQNDGYELNEDTIIVVEHFKIVDIFEEVEIDLHIVPMSESEEKEIAGWTDFALLDGSGYENHLFFSVYKGKEFVAFIRYRHSELNTYLFYNVNPSYEGECNEKDLIIKAEKYANDILLANNLIHEWSATYSYQK